MNASDQSSFGFRDVPAQEKVALVRGVFERVASRYDLMNDLMSAGVHHLWKDAMVARLNPQPGEQIVDLAGGTGDVARRILKMAEAARARRGGRQTSVTLIDYNAEMIRAGRAKPFPSSLSWAVGDAMALPLPDGSQDALTIAFGIRNVADVQKALFEARRVLKTGGRFLCLEFSRPPTALIRAAYDAYSFNVIPPLGGLVAQDRESYQYLVESIRRFPDQDSFADMMRTAGFQQVSYSNFSAGVAALHIGWAF